MNHKAERLATGSVAESPTDMDAEAPTIDFPEGRTRFNTEEVLVLAGISRGAKVYFLGLVAELGIVAERIGNSLTYDPTAVRQIARLHATRRGAHQYAPSPTDDPALRPARRRGRRRKTAPAA